MATTPDARFLPSTESLRLSARAAAGKGRPLVVMTTLKGCPYCDVVRGHYLLPMQRDGRIDAIQVDMRDSSSKLESFGGQVTTPALQVRTWKAKLAPTVLFLGPNGEELAERLIGMSVPDMYGQYLDMRLEQAARQLKPILPRAT